MNPYQTLCVKLCPRISKYRHEQNQDLLSWNLTAVQGRGDNLKRRLMNSNLISTCDKFYKKIKAGETVKSNKVLHTVIREGLLEGIICEKRSKACKSIKWLETSKNNYESRNYGSKDKETRASLQV